MSRTKADLVDYRIQRAYSTLQAAKSLAESGSWDSVTNRLYYACFYAVSALLAQNELDTYTHKGVKTMLSQHFIKSGLVSVSHGKLYNKLFEARNQADYEDFISIDEEKLGVSIDDVEQFVSTITDLAKQ